MIIFASDFFERRISWYKLHIIYIYRSDETTAKTSFGQDL